ncbi:DUF7674 family protein [Jeongeupia naejangsanensis]|uniref:DUF7674 domain-containing protein n=1 Tax=Jeongeupia naejangsanensis TaxID=613195 RepID=A0ABS2BR25_9NEIS|nr:hypothetical protein [Jeongeupia naejangsanensis]MBM3117244.1 hypothetical protein [Jeongeupia naejangsanensis]
MPMQHSAYADGTQILFDFVGRAYASGSIEVRNCINVAFVESLFWQVSRRTTVLCWPLLPNMTVLCRQYRNNGYVDARFAPSAFLAQGPDHAVVDLQ